MSELPTIDGYTDLVLVGRGGLGDVYRATQTATGAAVAIKILRDVSDSSVAWHRTRRELNALLALSGHAHVVQIVELLELPSGPALVMEHASGGSVADLLRERGGTLSVDEAVFVGRQTASALVSAHARGIVHRDIKPQNLLIDADGQVQLCDFGIAALTRDDEYRSRTNAISMRYASPEDLEQHDTGHDPGHDTGHDPDDLAVGPASDVYSLGATVLHIARGAPPTLRERLAPWEPPATADASLAALDRVVARCLHPTPSVRPTAQALVDALDGLALGAGAARVTALPVTDRSAARPASRMALDAQQHRKPDADRDADPDAVTVTRPRPGDVGRADRPVELPRPVPVGRRWHRPVLAALAVAVVAAATIVLWPSDDVAAPGPTTTTPATTVPITSTAPDGLVTRPRPAGLLALTDPAVVWTVGDVGDCLVQVPDQPELVVVPCAEPHDLQRYASGSVTDPGLDPGVDPDAAFDQAAVADAVTAACFAAFETFVGSPPADSALQTAQTRPNADSWAAGDREYHCSLGVEGARVVGDAAGSGW